MGDCRCLQSRCSSNNQCPAGDVCFVQGSKLIGVHWDYSDPAKIIEIQETANCRFQDIQRVKQTIKERRPGSIDIDLTQEQFDSCVTANNASNVKDD
jgi:hypothetical protein